MTRPTRTFSASAGDASTGNAGPDALETDLDAIIAMFDVPYCRVTRVAAQDATEDTDTAIAWDTEEADTDTMHSTVTNPSRITIATAGLYLITANVSSFPTPAGWQYLTILKNGTTKLAEISNYTDWLKIGAVSLTTMADLAVSDYIEVIFNSEVTCEVPGTYGAVSRPTSCAVAMIAAAA